MTCLVCEKETTKEKAFVIKQCIVRSYKVYICNKCMEHVVGAYTRRAIQDILMETFDTSFLKEHKDAIQKEMFKTFSKVDTEKCAKEDKESRERLKKLFSQEPVW
jgi:hypothetical protein